MTVVPAVSRGWQAGFGNLLDKELGSWWRTRRWILHLVMWPVLIGFFCLMEWLGSRDRNPAPAAGMENAAQLFFQLGGFFALLGAVLVTQGAIVGERRIGTAAWVLTKPATRAAFLLSKFVGIVGSFLLLSLVIPAIVWHVQVQLQWGVLPRVEHFLEAAGLLALHQTFYVALTLMLGTLFQHRGAVAGASLGFWIAGNILPNFIPAAVVAFLPWPLVNVAAAVALWKPVPVMVWIPALSTAVLTVICLAIALVRFEREEF